MCNKFSKKCFENFCCYILLFTTIVAPFGFILLVYGHVKENITLMIIGGTIFGLPFLFSIQMCFWKKKTNDFSSASVNQTVNVDDHQTEIGTSEQVNIDEDRPAFELWF
ncbi:hypothetical protein M0811_10855 [Anaeramoeba ignava]|uniref:Uncharacterized protein n=1 Tax=Anaeramoeba ignava TaxID=1746090 RepID=A0A9Q0R8D7_ANAIG|nr:hypothetical protein M0811_10855 [Anaeramoeba ignava]